MSEGIEDLVFSVVVELSDAGYNVSKELISRRTKLKPREINRALTSLTRRGMIVPRRWGAPPGTFIPSARSTDADRLSDENV